MTSAAARIDDTGEERFADELKPGTKLLYGQFTIESFLNSGGFGITYVAKDSLSRRVVVKECFPASFCRRIDNAVGPRSRQRQEEYRSIVNLFLQEAQNLARLDHPHIVKVHQVFEDNETAYMAMDYIQGPDLLETVEGKIARLEPQEIVGILGKVLDAVGYVHEQGLLHRDISPDNILLDRATGNPVLIDFGASRKEMTRKSRALSGLRVVKDGYSPQEFYIAGSKQAPCSDLYALAASFYHLITAETPCSSQERLSAIANREADPHRPLAGRIKGYPPAFLAAIDKAMAIFPRDRLQSAAEWQAMLREPTAAVALRTPQPVLPADAMAGLRVVDPVPVPTADPFPEVAARPVDRVISAQPAPRGVSAPVAPAPAARRFGRPPRDILMLSAAAMLLLAGVMSMPMDLSRQPTASQPQAIEVAALPTVAADAPFTLYRAVRLPFLADPADPTLVTDVLPSSPLWMQPGQRIVEVNGQPVQDGASLPAMLAQGVDLATVTELKAIIGYEAAPGADIVRKMEALAVVVELQLANGLAFNMVETPTGTRTVVAAVPTGAETDLQVGDVLLVYRPTGETIGTTGALSAILERELSGGVATFGFTVQRKGSTLDTTFRLTEGA
ncbi:protein kinase domain-containing protein [Tabrizicola aquatica]|uniref:protein kinase domain-containing protein n=1 Tax=Tabrizicola aquatica TaxID=909926 RepID=UPI0015E186E2|nr:protein kinase [Tabrizicola aquatica]